MEEYKFNVNEIFEGIQGEGMLMGSRATFIRLQGCNVRCPWCDTKHAWDVGEKKQMMTADEIVDTLGYSYHVVITGGEPTLHDLKGLLKAFNHRPWTVRPLIVQIETSGTNKCPDPCKYNRIDVRITLSPKPVREYRLHKSWEALRVYWISELKFVVDEDFEARHVLSFLKTYPIKDGIPIVLQPESNRSDMAHKASILQRELDLWPRGVYVRPQLHKVYKWR